MALVVRIVWWLYDYVYPRDPARQDRANAPCAARPLAGFKRARGYTPVTCRVSPARGNSDFGRHLASPIQETPVPVWPDGELH